MGEVTRRTMMAGVAGAPAFLQKRAEPPNILLVLSDDHSAPYLGCYGADYLKSPRLDRFASEGMRCDRAFTAAPQCVPSRTAILTGRSPVAARMGRFSSPLPADVVTAPELLRTRGYRTGVCGRYFHLNGVIKAQPHTQSVYDKHGLQTWAKRVDMMDVSPQQTTAEKLDRFIGESGTKPWFFWINYSDPHHVWDAKAGHVDAARIKLPAQLPDLPGVRADLARYCGEVERMDGFFGQAMDVLKTRGVEENTLVLFMGDNGMAFPHGKGSLYDPGMNVPMMARWPGRVKPGSTTEALISGEDVTPTFLDAAGVAAPKEMTGRSFLPLLTGAAAYEPRRHIFSARIPHGNAPFTPTTRAATFDLSRCVRSDGWKLIYNCTPQMEYWPVDSANDAGWQEMLAAHRAGTLKPEHERAYFQRPRPVIELFDLKRDPGELVNVAGRAETAEVQQALLEALQEKMIIDFDYLPPPFGN